jgi:hypothetical protein
MDFGLSDFQNITSSCHFLRQSTYRNQVHVALVEGSGKKSLECLLHEKLIHFDCLMQLMQDSESLTVLRKVPCQVHCLPPPSFNKQKSGKYMAG